MLNIFKVERVKIETEFDDEMMKSRATTTTMKKKNEKKKKWKKFENDASVVMTMKNEFKTMFFLSRLTMTIARKQRVERFFRKSR